MGSLRLVRKRKMVNFDFPVEEKRLIVEGVGEIRDRKAIVRTDTNTVLGIVSGRYKLVKHSEVINSVGKVLAEVGLKLDRVSLCRQGAVMFVKFYGNREFTREVKADDAVRFGLEVFNSYDGSMQIGVVLIAERLKYYSEMIAPETISSFFIKHYDRLDLGDVRRKSLDILEKSEWFLGRYRYWSRVEVEEDKVKDFFNELFRGRYGEMLFAKYLAEKEGDTVWDLYNFFTRWLTHEVRTRRGNEENRRLLVWNRECKITNKLVEWVDRLL